MSLQTYQWNAVDYAKSSSVQQQWARELLRKLELKGDEQILDIGCGDGKVTAEIALCVPNGIVLGIDSSSEMITLSQSLFPADAFSNLRFQCENASRLPFENKFDVVFSNATLHWVLDHKPVLQGICNSLRHGGRILLQMGGRNNAYAVENMMKNLINQEEWSRYFVGFNFSYGFYGPDEYNKWLREAGLYATRVELIPKDAKHEGRLGLESWIRTTWLPYTHQVPEKERELFIAQLADDYLQQHPADENGIVHVDMMRLEVEAVKQ
jgi:trans-aconitate 2-methyltransferase